MPYYLDVTTRAGRWSQMTTSRRCSRQTAVTPEQGNQERAHQQGAQRGADVVGRVEPRGGWAASPWKSSLAARGKAMPTRAASSRANSGTATWQAAGGGVAQSAQSAERRRQAGGVQGQGGQQPGQARPRPRRGRARVIASDPMPQPQHEHGHDQPHLIVHAAVEHLEAEQEHHFQGRGGKAGGEDGQRHAAESAPGRPPARPAAPPPTRRSGSETGSSSSGGGSSTGSG